LGRAEARRRRQGEQIAAPSAGGEAVKRALHRSRHLMPSISTAASKVSQLLLLSAVSYVYVGDRANLMLVSYILVSSFVQLSDSGAIGYLLVNSNLASNARAVTRVLLIQVLTVGAGVIAGLLCAIVFVGLRDPSLIGVLVALSVVQLADGLSRIVRSVFLIRAEPMSFALPEFAVAGVRSAMMVAAIFTANELYLSLSWVPSVIVLVFSVWAVARHFDRSAESVAVPFRAVLLYGVSSSINALYSQSPVMIASVLLTPAVSAPLAVAFRMAQAAEFIPVTFAQQLLPKVKDNLGKSRQRVLLFAGLGLVVGAGLWVFRDVLAILVNFPAGTTFILFILILSLPFKYANHYLISLTMAVNLLRQKTILTSVLAVFCVALSIIVCVWIGTAVSVGILAACVEVVLAATLLILLRARSAAFSSSRAV
jgi:hypothetical protein